MSDANEGAGFDVGGLSREQRTSAIFASLVVNQTQMAMMLLGRVPHPGTGQTTKDLDGARLFIDQLEMLEEKTKGNLDQHERKLLRDHLTALHMAFVEAAEERAGATTPETTPGETGKAESKPAGPVGAGQSEALPDGGGDSRKKFTKKY
jgi:hypothetical protein